MGMLMRRRIQRMKEDQIVKNVESKDVIDLQTEDTDTHTEEELTPEENEEAYKFTYEELSSMTVKQIKEIAEQRGYIITKIIKDDVISEFLLQQK